MKSPHRWKFYRIGKLDQVALESAEDLLHLAELDQKLWVALSCPTSGLELDEATLKLIDTDADGHIRAPELLTAVAWAAARLKDPAELLRGVDGLPVDSIREDTPEGKLLGSSIHQVVERIAKQNFETITVADISDTAKIISATPINGDGVIPPSASGDADVQMLIKDIIETVGGTKDRTGDMGVTVEQADQFFKDANAYVDWLKQSADQEVAIFGEDTDEAVSCLQAVRDKINDYFARTNLAAFDERSINALNHDEGDYARIAEKGFVPLTDELKGLPISHIGPNRPLPLLEKVNPAWREALAKFHAKVVTRIFGAERTTLTEDEWKAINAKLAPYEAWTAGKAGANVEKLGIVRIREILSGGRAALDDLFAKDKALEPEFQAISDVERLVRYYRDLRELLHNFVNFLDFYSPDKHATFQAGTLYLDSRASELCVKVAGPNPLAQTSKLYLAYCECRRAGEPNMQIVAAFTQGNSDYLSVGRNGIFYDRKGRDWDATITSIVDNPVSVRQAFWTPYKKVASFVEGQVSKFASDKDKKADSLLAGSATTPAAPGAPAFDIAKFAGIFAAIGLAIGAIGGALAALGHAFVNLDPWYWKLVAVAGALLLISGPSMLFAALKLRQRTIGPLLDGNGWAVNGRVKISIRFGARLTTMAKLPKGAKRDANDPYGDRMVTWRRRVFFFLIVLLVIGWIAIRVDQSRHGHYFWQDPPPAAEAPAEPVPASPAAPTNATVTETTPAPAASQ